MMFCNEKQVRVKSSKDNPGTIIKCVRIIRISCLKIIMMQRHTWTHPRFGECSRQLQIDGLIDGGRQHFKSLTQEKSE